MRRHDDDRVCETDHTPLTVSQSTIIQYLKQNITNIWMCLFNLINQDNRIGLATVDFSQIATVFTSHITRRSPMRRATACFPSIPTCRCVLMLLPDRIEIHRVPSTTESFLHCSTPSLNPPLLTRKGYLGPTHWRSRDNSTYPTDSNHASEAIRPHWPSRRYEKYASAWR